jgi:exopolyphosphatase/guanosine-5'-triphosphate,3'-diphosphate pyrophosphatase
MRVAALDIGTNTCLLLIAESVAGHPLTPILERAEITRLGQGVDRTRRLAPDAIARTCACLDDYVDLVRKSGVDRIAVVGTSAMRDAAGGDAVRTHVRAAFGVDVRVVSGDEEARLAFRGAVSGLGLHAAEHVGVFDIGGGSTEVILGSVGAGRSPQGPAAHTDVGRSPQGPAAHTDDAPRISFAMSFDVGSVRLTERHIVHDPPSEAELAATMQAASAAFAEVPPLPGPTTPIAVAGTMTTLASVSLALVPYDGARVHGHVMTRADLSAVIERLSKLDLAARKAVPGIEPKRADVLIAGGVVALALLEHWRAGSVRISDRGVRWGLAEELCATGG